MYREVFPVDDDGRKRRMNKTKIMTTKMTDMDTKVAASQVSLLITV